MQMVAHDEDLQVHKAEPSEEKCVLSEDAREEEEQNSFQEKNWVNHFEASKVSATVNLHLFVQVAPGFLVLCQLHLLKTCVEH